MQTSWGVLVKGGHGEHQRESVIHLRVTAKSTFASPIAGKEIASEHSGLVQACLFAHKFGHSNMLVMLRLQN